MLNGPELWNQVIKELSPYFHRPFIAGGALRDYLIGSVPPKDIDVFVYRSGEKQLTQDFWLQQLSEALRPEEYTGRYNVGGIFEGLFLGHTVQVIWTDQDDPDTLVSGFDFGINRTFYIDYQIFDTYAAFCDRDFDTVTLLSDHSVDASLKRFDRLQERYANRFKLVNPKEDLFCR